MATQSSWRAGPGLAAAPNNSNANANGGSAARWGPGMHRTSGNVLNTAPASAHASHAVTAPQSSSNGTHAASKSAANSQGNVSAQSQSAAVTSESVQRDRITFLLVGLVGNTVVATTKSGAQYIGILSSTSTGSSPLSTTYGVASTRGIGIVLSCAQQIERDDVLGPVKKTLIIPPDEMDGFVAREVGLDVPVSAAQSAKIGFRTDTEISNALDPYGEGRILQKWSDESLDEPLENTMSGLSLDNKPSHGGGGWDQFAANEAKFGIKSNYEETLYTTKLDRSGKDFRERERQADQLAREIMGGATSNSHIAEERNLVPQGGESGPTEEDRYGAVVRGEGAYIPPAARRAAAASTGDIQKSNGSAPPLGAVPASASIALAAAPAAESASLATRPAPPSIVTTAPHAPPGASREDAKPLSAMQPQQSSQQGPFSEFQKFVSSEKERLTRKKATLAKEFELSDLKKWADQFKVSYPVPDDLAQSRAAAQSKMPAKREPTQKSMSPTPQASTLLGAPSNAAAGIASANVSPASGPGSLAQLSAQQQAGLLDTKAMIAKMTIPKIPPFDADKVRARQAEARAAQQVVAAQTGQVQGGAAPASSKSTFKLSAKATIFNPNASTFTPGASFKPSATPAAVPVMPPQSTTAALGTIAATPSVTAKPAVPVNPFFGNRVIKKAPPTLHIRDDFNPFKTGKVPDANTVGPKWSFSGKPYRQLFQAIPSDDMPAGGLALGMGQTMPMTAQGKVGGPSSGPPSGVAPINMLGHQGIPLGMSSPQIPQPSPQLPPAHVQHPHQPPQHMQSRPAQGIVPQGTAGGNNMAQPVYMPYPGYRLPGGQQQSLHHLPGSPYVVPPQMMGQVPFSPPMAHTGPHGIYSPQMAGVLPGALMPNMMAAGQALRGNHQGGAHLQQKGGPPALYYAQPVPGLPYGMTFPANAGPSPGVRPQHLPHHPQSMYAMGQDGSNGPQYAHAAGGPTGPAQGSHGPVSGQPMSGLANTPSAPNTAAVSPAGTPVLPQMPQGDAAPTHGGNAPSS